MNPGALNTFTKINALTETLAIRKSCNGIHLIRVPDPVY